MTRSRSRAFLGLLVFASAASACERSEPLEETSAVNPDAGTGPVVDPKLAAAMAAASAHTAPTGVEAGQGGPPPKGIFAPGQADKEIARGAAPKLTVGSTGSAPKVELGGGFRPGFRAKGVFTLAIQNDPRQGALPLEVDVELETKKNAPAGAEAPLHGEVRVLSATVSARGGVPPDLSKRIAALKGTKVTFSVMPGGGGTGFSHELPKAAEPALNDFARSLSDLVATIALPFPSEPLGAGAFWMATSRDGVMGLDLVTYRLVKVEKVENGVAELSLNTKRYATSKGFGLEGLGGTFTLDEFRSTADGTLSVPAGSPLPRTGKLDLALAASLIPEGDQNARGSLQAQTRARFELSLPAAHKANQPAAAPEPAAAAPKPAAPAPQQPAPPVPAAPAPQ